MTRWIPGQAALLHEDTFTVFYTTPPLLSAVYPRNPEQKALWTPHRDQVSGRVGKEEHTISVQQDRVKPGMTKRENLLSSAMAGIQEKAAAGIVLVVRWIPLRVRGKYGV